MRLAFVIHLTGVLVRLFAGAFLAPLAVALYYGERHDALGFLFASLASLLAGHLMRRVAEEPRDLRRVEGMAVVAGTWLLVAMFGAVPYVWAGVGPIDALFESMSGLTTTGATTFADFSLFGRGIFFWRSLTQWLGGLGVIALFVAILPRLAIGGRQLFFAEAPGPTDEKLTPQIRKTAAALWLLYTGLTLAETGALRAVGLPWFDSVCHAFTTLAAGGFSLLNRLAAPAGAVVTALLLATVLQQAKGTWGTYTMIGFEDWRQAMEVLSVELEGDTLTPVLFRSGFMEEDQTPLGSPVPTTRATLRSPGREAPDFNLIPLTASWNHPEREDYFETVVLPTIDIAETFYLLSGSPLVYASCMVEWINEARPGVFEARRQNFGRVTLIRFRKAQVSGS